MVRSKLFLIDSYYALVESLRLCVFALGFIKQGQVTEIAASGGLDGAEA
jgi:hypothetical protein